MVCVHLSLGFCYFQSEDNELESGKGFFFLQAYNEK